MGGGKEWTPQSCKFLSFDQEMEGTSQSDLAITTGLRYAYAPVTEKDEDNNKNVVSIDDNISLDDLMTQMNQL